MRLGVVDHAVGDGNVVGDDEGRVCGYGALLHGGGYGKGLESGPWLVWVGQDPVALVLHGDLVEAVVVAGVLASATMAPSSTRMTRPTAPLASFSSTVASSLFQLLLHGGIQGQVHVLAALEGLVVAGFDTSEGVAVLSNVSHKLAGQGLLGRYPNGVGDDRDPRYAEPGDLTGRLGSNAGGDTL